MRAKWIALVVCLVADWGVASRLNHADRIRQDLSLSPEYDRIAAIDKVKIAILDIGFKDCEDPGVLFLRGAAGLPRAELITRFPNIQRIPDNELLPRDTHGCLMAKTIWGITHWIETREGRPVVHGPHLVLMNSRGAPNFNAAAGQVMAADSPFRIVLYALNWESAGNFDGGGFINAIVSRVTDANVHWINNAGNYGGLVYNGPIQPVADAREARGVPLRFSNGQHYLRFKSTAENNRLSIITAWNAFPERWIDGTDKDLNVVVEDEDGNLIDDRQGRLVQIRGQAREGRDGIDSPFPRELISLSNQLEKNKIYRIRIFAVSNNFDSQHDKVRVTVVSDRHDNTVRFLDATNSREIMIPADNPKVITIGDRGYYSSRGLIEATPPVKKPDGLMPVSVATFDDGQNHANAVGSTSNAAAYFAGADALLWASLVDDKERSTRPNDPVSFPARAVFDHLASLEERNIAGTRREQQRDREALNTTRRNFARSLSQVTSAVGADNISSYSMGGDARRAGRLTIEVKEFTPELRRFFTLTQQGFRWENIDQYECYLAEVPRDQRLFGFVRHRDSSRLPWQWEHPRHIPALLGPGNPNAREFFIPVRTSPLAGAPDANIPDWLEARLWRTPTRIQLRDLVRTATR